jgi:serine/threonine protein kinase
MDVKSPNVLLGRNNAAKLADVGLAKFLHKDYLSVAKSVGTFAWSVSAPPPQLAGGTSAPDGISTQVGYEGPT